MAKMAATESAQSRRSTAHCRCSAAAASSAASTVERLYREIRSLRIYEGATEVQKLIIGREVCSDS